MKVIRFNVFETNSSSTHTLSLCKVDRKFTKKGKLVSGFNYKYSPMGSDKRNKYKKNQIFVCSSEYEKLCAMFDLLFIDLSNKLARDLRNISILSRYKKSAKDSEFDLFNRYVLHSLLKGNYFHEFKMVLKKHNITFEVDKNILDVSKRSPLYCTALDGSNFDFMTFFINFGFQSIGETIDTIVFDPKYKIEVSYQHD